MAERAGPLELAEYGFLVLEEVADKPVGLPVMHGQRGFDARAEDARGKGVAEAGYEGFVGGGEFDEAGEVCGDGVEGRDVGQAELAEGVLQHGNAGRVGCFGCGGVVYRFDNLVDL